MKRIFLFFLSVFIIGILSSAVSAETITLRENLALALQSADMFDSNGNKITAAVISFETVSSETISYDAAVLSLNVNADSVAVIDFSGVELRVTSQDFESFDLFTGLEKLTISLPDSFTGEFLPSFDKLALLDVSGSTADFILSLYRSLNLVSVDASSCENLKAVNLAVVKIKTISADLPGMQTLTSLLMGDLVIDSISSPLNSLVNLDVSGCPNLDRVGYGISIRVTTISPVISGDTGGMVSVISSIFGNENTIPLGYKTHNCSQKRHSASEL